MPHSSGGGSHGGGFHSSGGGHRSSGSRSSSGGGDSRPTVTVSHEYFQGARRYVYYDRRGRYHNYYTSGVPEKASLSTTIFAVLLFSFIALPILYFLMQLGLYIPRKLDATSYQSAIVVEDRCGFLEESELEPALQEFLDATGVAPSIQVVYDSDWQEDYGDLEVYAYSEYLRLFDDEKHWLVVLSYPDDYETVGFVDWKWEGMVGDDCYPAFNSTSEELFTKTIHKYLLRSDASNLTTCLANAYHEFAENGMKVQTGIGFLITVLAVLIIYLFLCYVMISDYRTNKNLERAIPATVKAKEMTCEYCGTRYVAGTLTNCVNCGAPIPAIRPKSEV